MIIVEIDVAIDKHKCFIMNSDGKIFFNTFVIQNNREGYDDLYGRICSVTDDFTKVKVGLVATGRYSLNILDYLLDKSLPTYVINPLYMNIYRKSLSLRKTKIDKADTHIIADILLSDANLKSYSNILQSAKVKRYFVN